MDETGDEQNPEHAQEIRQIDNMPFHSFLAVYVTVNEYG